MKLILILIIQFILIINFTYCIVMEGDHHKNDSSNLLRYDVDTTDEEYTIEFITQEAIHENISKLNGHSIVDPLPTCNISNNPQLKKCLEDLKDDLQDHTHNDCTSCRVHCCISLKFYHCIRQIDTCHADIPISYLTKSFDQRYIFYHQHACSSFRFPSTRCFFYLRETAIMISLFTFIFLSFSSILIISLYYTLRNYIPSENRTNNINCNRTNSNNLNRNVQTPPTPPPSYTQAKNQMRFPPPPTYEEVNVNNLPNQNVSTVNVIKDKN